MSQLQFLQSLSSFNIYFLNEEGLIINANTDSTHLAKDIFAKLIKNSKTSGEQWFSRTDDSRFFIQYEITKNPEAAGYILIATDLTEKKQQLQRDEKFFSMSLDMLAQANMQGYFTRLNPAWTQTLGYTEEELCSKPCTDFIHPDDIQKTIDTIAKQKDGAEVWSFENRYRTKDGKYKWLSWKSFPDGDMMYGAARDITDIKESQQQIIRLNSDLVKLNAELEKNVQESLERTQTILTLAPVTLWSIDATGIIQFYEGRGLTTLPQSDQKHEGRNIFEACAPYPLLTQALKDALSGKNSEATTELPTGFFKTRIIPQFNSQKKVTGAVGVTIDVTAETRQAVEKRKWEEIFERAPWGIAIASAEHKISMVNPAFVKMHGGTVQDWIGFPAGKMYAEEKMEEHQARKEKMAKEDRLHFESDHIKIDGASFPVLSDLSLIRDDSGKPLYVVGNFFDLTNEKRIQEDARLAEIREKSALEASKLKSTFLANMSHEIRTPINGVVGMTHLLKDTPLSAEQKDLCDNISRSAESLLTVINDILDFSKVEAGKLEIENVAFDLTEVLNETVRTMAFAAQKKAIALRLEYENPLSQLVISDPGRLRQVLNNLLSNAIKFTSEGFVVLRARVQQTQDKAQLHFEIQDTGIGISTEAQTKLFEPFIQADSSTTRRYGGSGLGLSISKGLVSLLGGTIGVKSTAGKGSTFWFDLDVSLSKGVVNKKSAQETFTRTTKFNNAYILVAEDNQINQIVAIKMLEKMGYRPQAVANGHEVLKALAERDYDLILMDCQMPELDGYEATQKLRQLEDQKYKNLPVIAMTANAVAGDKEKCLAAGMNDYISKPVEPETLFAAIEKWLTQSQTSL